jgi:hypothetical protein
VGGENKVMNPKVKGGIGMYVNCRPKILDKNLIKTYMPLPHLPYFKVNICPLPLPHFASIFFA